MRFALIAFVVAALALSVGPARAAIFLYEDFESGAPGWEFSAGDFWHLETYRSNSGSYSAAYNRGAEGYYDYDEGPWNSGELFSPLIDFSGATSVYFEFYSWLETENAAGDSAYYYDIAQVGLYTDAYAPVMSFTPDVNYFAHAQWERIYTPGDIKPIMDSYGYSEYRLGFHFDSVDTQFNNYEGWYLDDITIYGDVEEPVIPEPSTLLLLGSGLLGLASAVRRRISG